MEIKVKFAKNLYDPNKERLARSIVTRTQQYLNLPNIVEIHFQSLGRSAYGETDITTKRITINFDLELNDLLLPLLHELIHLEQIHTGLLNKSRNGEYIWNGQVYFVDPLTETYENYKQLPWEIDSEIKQKKLLQKLLILVDNKS